MGSSFFRVITTIKWPVKSGPARVIDPYLGGPIIRKKHMQNMSTTIAVDITNQPTNKHRFCTRFSAINCAELTERRDKKSHVTFYFHLSMKCGVVHTYHVSMPWRVGVSDYQIQDFKEIINRSTPARWDPKPSSRGPANSTYFDRWNNPSYRHL